MSEPLKDIDFVREIKVKKEVVGIPVGNYSVFSEDDLGIGFYLTPIGNVDPDKLSHILKYVLKRFINQNFVEVLV